MLILRRRCCWAAPGSNLTACQTVNNLRGRCRRPELPTHRPQKERVSRSGEARAMSPAKKPADAPVPENGNWQNQMFAYASPAQPNEDNGAQHVAWSSGWLRHSSRNQRYSPSKRRRRASTSPGSPEATRRSQVSINFPKSSGWIAKLQPEPRACSRERPVKSSHRWLGNSVAPSGRHDHASAGIASIIVRSWSFDPSICECQSNRNKQRIAVSSYHG